MNVEYSKNFENIIFFNLRSIYGHLRSKKYSPTKHVRRKQVCLIRKMVLFLFLYDTFYI